MLPLQQWLVSSAALSSLGSLTSLAVQQQTIAALGSGAGALGSDVFVPGHNLWSAVLQPWPALGALTAAASARLATSLNLAAASALTGSLSTRMPVSAAEAGTGQLAPVASSLQLGATTNLFGSTGALTAAYQQLLASSSILSGTGSLVGDVSRLTGGQIQQIDAVTYLGLSALTAQTAQWLLASATQLSGAGAFTPSLASIVKPLTLTAAGQGLMAALALQQMVRAPCCCCRCWLPYR